MRLLILVSLIILLHMIKSEMNKNKSLENAEIFFNDLPEMYKYNTDEVMGTVRGEMNRRYADENISAFHNSPPRALPALASLLSFPGSSSLRTPPPFSSSADSRASNASNASPEARARQSRVSSRVPA